MARMILRRLLAAIPSLVGIVVLTFLMTHLLPGDPAAYFAGPAATPASIAQIRAQLGLDHSLARQFVDYVVNLTHLDLGRSLTSGQTVVNDLRNRLPATLELTLTALVLASVIGIGLGLAAALRPGSWVDQLCRAVSILGQAIPTFFLGLLLIFIFYYRLGWSPAPMGRISMFATPPPQITGFWTIDALLAGQWGTFQSVVSHLVLPVITLAMFGIGPIARMTRATLIEVLDSDFIRTVHAYGLSRIKIIWTYAFSAAAVPVLNTVGMVLSFLLGANVLVEKVFGWPGVGAYAVNALLASDYAPVQGFVLLMALLYLLINLAIDIAAVLLDPRVRLDG